MENNKTIDFGEINIPTKWDDLNLYQYQEIQKAKENEADLITIVSILSKTDENTIRIMPASFISKILQKLAFLGAPPEIKPSNKLGDLYIKNPDELTFGEWLDVNNTIQNNKYDYATILAILCRRTDEEYNEQFINQMLKKRTDYFGQQPITNVLPLVLFFSTYSIISMMTSQDSLNQLYTQVESIAQNKKRSERNGVFNKAYTFLRKKMSLKSRKS